MNRPSFATRLSAPPGGPRVKGVAFRTVDRCFVELWGKELHAAAHTLMPPEVATAYKYGTILAASWYPISWYREVFGAYRKAAGEGLELPRRIGKRAVQLDMRGVHKRLLAYLVSPAAMLAIAQRVFSTYYDTGRFELEESRSGFARVRLSGCRGWDENMWTEMIASSGALLETAGAKALRIVVVAGGGPQAVSCELEANWEE